MSRRFTIAIALLVFSLCAFLLPALPQGADKGGPAKPAPVVRAGPATRAIIQLLQQPISTKDLHELIKLKDALEKLADQSKGKLVVFVDKEAFLDDAEAPDPYEQEVSLPVYPAQMLTEQALRLLIPQLGKRNATFVIRNSWIEITTMKASNLQMSNTLFRPSIVAIYDQRPLPDVLQDLTEKTGISINLDPQVGDKGNTPITATFRNSSLRDALLVVTEMARLKFAVLGDSIYVTTPEHAIRLEREDKVLPKRPAPRSTEAAE